MSAEAVRRRNAAQQLAPGLVARPGPIRVPSAAPTDSLPTSSASTQPPPVAERIRTWRTGPETTGDRLSTFGRSTACNAFLGSGQVAGQSAANPQSSVLSALSGVPLACHCSASLPSHAAVGLFVA